VVARRQLQFPTKAASAQSKGAVAVVIYDRDDRFEADGETLNLIDRSMTTGGAEDTVGIPVFAITMAQGEAIIAGINTYGARATGSFHCAEGGAECAKSPSKAGCTPKTSAVAGALAVPDGRRAAVVVSARCTRWLCQSQSRAQEPAPAASGHDMTTGTSQFLDRNEARS
jgi:hypothetical protein